MANDLTAIKREKINQDVSTGLVRVQGNERSKSGGNGYQKSPTKNLVMENNANQMTPHKKK